LTWNLLLADTAAHVGNPGMSSQTEAYLKHWRILPSWSAPTIDSEERLALLEKFETPVLGGGLGSMMFQIAMVCSYLFRPFIILNAISLCFYFSDLIIK
jgi:hypothetical protein